MEGLCQLTLLDCEVYDQAEQAQNVLVCILGAQLLPATSAAVLPLGKIVNDLSSLYHEQRSGGRDHRGFAVPTCTVFLSAGLAATSLLQGFCAVLRGMHMHNLRPLLQS